VRGRRAVRQGSQVSASAFFELSISIIGTGPLRNRWSTRADARSNTTSEKTVHFRRTAPRNRLAREVLNCQFLLASIKDLSRLEFDLRLGQKLAKKLWGVRRARDPALQIPVIGASRVSRVDCFV
jgi:hypothetical protein